MEKYAVQHETVFKEEPFEPSPDWDASLNCNAVPLNVNVDEMDLKDLKIDKYLYELEENDTQKEIVQHPLPRTIRRKFGRMTMDFEKVRGIAKAYADLFSNEVPRSFPFHNFNGRTVNIACPRCMIPSKCTSRSAFLTLLNHISNTHAESSEELFADIVKRYAPFIEYMKRATMLRTRTNYLFKLRSLEHRIPLLGTDMGSKG